MTKSEEYQRAFHLYQVAHDGNPAGTMSVAEWAVQRGLLVVPLVDPLAVLAERMAAALREEYATDASGRRYRKNHAVRIMKHGVQLALWAEMRNADRHHMLKAFQQRRRQIVNDCVQLKVDVDVYNGMNATVEPIQLVLDFTDDVAEDEAAKNYGDKAA